MQAVEIKAEFGSKYSPDAIELHFASSKKISSDDYKILTDIIDDLDDLADKYFSNKKESGKNSNAKN